MKFVAMAMLAALTAPAQAADVFAKAYLQNTNGTTAYRVESSSTSTPPFQPQVYSDVSLHDASAWASSDLSQGALRGAINPGTTAYRTGIEAYLGDSYTFSIAGASADTITRLALDIMFDGSVRGNSSIYLDTFLNFGFARVTNQLSLRQDMMGNVVFQSGTSDVTRPGTVQSFAYSSLGDSVVAGSYLETLYFDVRGANPTISFGSQLSANGEVNFGNSAHFGFRLPSNVTATSASGLGFVTMQAGAVPEPATWAMLVLGFGVVGGALRRGRPRAALT